MRTRKERKPRKARAIQNKSAYTKRTGQRWDPHNLIDLAALAEQKLPNGAPRYYFFMHEFPKVGLNPKATYDTTPLGVYTYPLTPALYVQFLDNDLPYVSEAAYMTVMEAVQPDAMLAILRDPKVLAKVTERSRRPGISSRLTTQLKTKLPALEEDPGHIYRRIQTRTLWNDTSWEADLWNTSAQKVETGNTALFARNLLKAGYTSAYDAGFGVIHPNEPTQCVFLSPKAFRIVETFSSKALRGTFPKTTQELVADLGKLGTVYAGMVLSHVIDAATEDDDFKRILRSVPAVKKVKPVAPEGVTTTLGVLPEAFKTLYDQITQLDFAPPARTNAGKKRPVEKPTGGIVQAPKTKVKVTQRDVDLLWAARFNAQLMPTLSGDMATLLAKLEHTVAIATIPENNVGLDLTHEDVEYHKRSHFAVLTSDKGWVIVLPVPREPDILLRMADWGETPPFHMRPARRGEVDRYLQEPGENELDTYMYSLDDQNQRVFSRIWEHVLEEFKKGNSAPLEFVNRDVVARGYLPFKLQYTVQNISKNSKHRTWYERTVQSYTSHYKGYKHFYGDHNPTFQDLEEGG